MSDSVYYEKPVLLDRDTHRLRKVLPSSNFAFARKANSLYLAAVGGTAVGRDLLELTAEAFALVRKEEPDARMVMVTGPRLDPGLLPDVEGMDKVGYVDSLFEHLACADLAVVQGGLSTTMET